MNSHAQRHWFLRPVCIPIPPLLQFIGTGGEIRTLTLQILSLLSLPLDYTCLVGRGGFEPPTLKGAAGLQPGALPLCHPPMAEMHGFEP